jgi:hypothetical protein
MQGLAAELDGLLNVRIGRQRRQLVGCGFVGRGLIGCGGLVRRSGMLVSLRQALCGWESKAKDTHE